jgi:hypothetical protein
MNSVFVRHNACLCAKYVPVIQKPKYLGTVVTRDNLIEEEIKERIAAGN